MAVNSTVFSCPGSIDRPRCYLGGLSLKGLRLPSEYPQGPLALLYMASKETTWKETAWRGLLPGSTIQSLDSFSIDWSGVRKVNRVGNGIFYQDAQ